MGFPGDSAGKESTFNAVDLGSTPGLGRSLGEEKVYLLQYSGLENSMDCIVRGVAESETAEQLSLSFSHPYMTTGKIIPLTIWTFVSKVMSLLFSTLDSEVNHKLGRGI